MGNRIDINNLIGDISSSFQQEIRDFSKIVKNRKSQKKSLPTFNLIEELHPDNKKMYENAHTRILGAILDFDWEFKRSFLSRCCGMKYVPKTKISVHVERQYIKKDGVWEISKKQKGDEGVNLCRPDCLILSPTNFAVIIENKINGAPETERQLDNYLEAIPSDNRIFDPNASKPKNVWVVYLGGDTAVMPSDYSLMHAGNGFLKPKDYLIDDKDGRQPGKKLCLLSYRDTIIPWLEEDVLPKCPFGMTGLTGGLMVYIDYLKKRFIDNLSEDERFYESTDVVRFFRDKIESKMGMFYDKKYTATSTHINSVENGLGTDKKIEFYKALRNFYLNHHFRFSGANAAKLNETWAIRTNGAFVHLWKKEWEAFQDKHHLTCDLYFEFFPYQVDGYTYQYDEFIKKAITCCLRYKGKDGNLLKLMNSELNKKGFVPIGEYVFNKQTQMMGNTLSINKGDPFFDSFVENPIITQMCAAIKSVLQNY